MTKPYFDEAYLNAYAALKAIDGPAVAEAYGLDKSNTYSNWALACAMKPRALAEAVSDYIESHELTEDYEAWINGGCK